MADTDLTPTFIEKVQQPLRCCWDKSPLKKVVSYPRAQTRAHVDNLVAISYCLDRDDLVNGKPELYRLLHRIVDLNGREAVCSYIARYVRLIDPS